MNSEYRDREFDLAVPLAGGGQLPVRLPIGGGLFLLGANGSGKSSLIHRYYTHFSGRSRLISAHRQTWLESNSVLMSSDQKRQVQQNMEYHDSQASARWLDGDATTRVNLAISDVLAAEGASNREIALAVRANNPERAIEISDANPSPLIEISELLEAANLPISLSILQGEELQASKRGSEYGIQQLSDGERNAFLLSANVLTADPGTLFLIDEPERHLHRSIAAPLLGSLFAKRADCSFVVSTHELGLPICFPESEAILLREPSFDGEKAVSWDADVLKPGQLPDERLRRDVLGARRKILFVEGDSGSLDKPLYGALFPEISVIPKGGRSQIMHAVKGLRSAQDVAWVQAFGVVDRDDDTEAEVEALRQDSVFAIDFCAVESIYYHPEMQVRVVRRQAELLGGDTDARVTQARELALCRVHKCFDRLVNEKTQAIARKLAHAAIPAEFDINKHLLVDPINVPEIWARERKELETSLNAGDLRAIVERYPIRKTGALAAIAKGLKFQKTSDYEQAVHRLLVDDPDARDWAMSGLGGLPGAISRSASDSLVHGDGEALL